MAINFPTSLDTLTNPTASDYLNSPSHAAQHANANDILEALEAKVGINSSAVTTSHDYKLSAAGLGAIINGLDAKTTPVDADMVGLMDSAASNVLKKLSWANIKATLLTWLTTDSTNILRDSLFYQALINGNFDVWQRGTSFALTADSQYTADRWFGRSETSTDDKTISRQDGTGVEGSYYCARVQRPNGQSTTTAIMLNQALESQDSIKFRGKKLTLSFWARKGANFSAASDILVASIKTGKGTDQKVRSFTTSADAASENKTLTTSWQKFTITTSAVIASDITQIGVDFAFTPTGTAGADDYFEITQVQLNAGDTALPFQAKSFEEELYKCMRFYEKSFNYETAPANGSTSTTSAEENSLTYVYTGNWSGGYVPYKVKKRDNPGVTNYGNNSGYWMYQENQTTRSGQATAGYSTGNQNGFLAQQQFNGSTVPICGHWVADAEF